MDYIIEIRTAYKDRLERIQKRDYLLRKKTLVRRDKEVNDSLKKGKRKADKIIYNNGQKEELELAAEEVYERIINPKDKIKQSVKEKYKVENIPQKVNYKKKERLKDKRKTR